MNRVSTKPGAVHHPLPPSREHHCAKMTRRFSKGPRGSLGRDPHEGVWGTPATRPRAGRTAKVKRRSRGAYAPPRDGGRRCALSSSWRCWSVSQSPQHAMARQTSEEVAQLRSEVEALRIWLEESRAAALTPTSTSTSSPTPNSTPTGPGPEFLTFMYPAPNPLLLGTALGDWCNEGLGFSPCSSIDGDGDCCRARHIVFARSR